jgi:hypothetical protein
VTSKLEAARFSKPQNRLTVGCTNPDDHLKRRRLLNVKTCVSSLKALKHGDKERSSLFYTRVAIPYPSPCIYIEHHLLNPSAAICPVVCSFLQSSLLPPLASLREHPPPPRAFTFHLSGARRDLPGTPSALSLRSADKSPVHRTPFASYTASCTIKGPGN